MLLRQANAASAKDVIMFLENEYFFSDSTERKEISVVRVGSCEHEVVVRYETEAVAKPDGGVSKHRAGTGFVTFVAGDAFEVLPISTDRDGP